MITGRDRGTLPLELNCKRHFQQNMGKTQHLNDSFINDPLSENCNKSLQPKVNPIFLWVCQREQRIIKVRCENYDKRNRIKLTKTAQGWRSVPRTATITTEVGENEVQNASLISSSPKTEEKENSSKSVIVRNSSNHNVPKDAMVDDMSQRLRRKRKKRNDLQNHETRCQDFDSQDGRGEYLTKNKKRKLIKSKCKNSCSRRKNSHTSKKVDNCNTTQGSVISRFLDKDVDNSIMMAKKLPISMACIDLQKYQPRVILKQLRISHLPMPLRSETQSSSHKESIAKQDNIKNFEKSDNILICSNFEESYYSQNNNDTNNNKNSNTNNNNYDPAITDHHEDKSSDNENEKNRINYNKDHQNYESSNNDDDNDLESDNSNSIDFDQKSIEIDDKNNDDNNNNNNNNNNNYTFTRKPQLIEPNTLERHCGVFATNLLGGEEIESRNDTSGFASNQYKNVNEKSSPSYCDYDQNKCASSVQSLAKTIQRLERSINCKSSFNASENLTEDDNLRNDNHLTEFGNNLKSANGFQSTVCETISPKSENDDELYADNMTKISCSAERNMLQIKQLKDRASLKSMTVNLYDYEECFVRNSVIFTSTPSYHTGRPYVCSNKNISADEIGAMASQSNVISYASDKFILSSHRSVSPANEYSGKNDSIRTSTKSNTEGIDEIVSSTFLESKVKESRDRTDSKHVHNDVHAFSTFTENFCASVTSEAAGHVKRHAKKIFVQPVSQDICHFQCHQQNLDSDRHSMSSSANLEEHSYKSRMRKYEKRERLIRHSDLTSDFLDYFHQHVKQKRARRFDFQDVTYSNNVIFLDPASQLRELIRTSGHLIPDPLLVPRGYLSVLASAPLTEIPKLLASRPELRLPNALTRPELLRDPNLLVISLAHFQYVLEHGKNSYNNDLYRQRHSLSTKSPHSESFDVFINRSKEKRIIRPVPAMVAIAHEIKESTPAERDYRIKVEDNDHVDGDFMDKKYFTPQECSKIHCKPVKISITDKASYSNDSQKNFRI